VSRVDVVPGELNPVPSQDLLPAGGVGNLIAAPLKLLPEPVDLEQYRVRRQTRVGGLIGEYHLVA
jgi:hypothetical protein